MLLGPIFSLELVTSARRGRYFLVRVLYALVLLLTLAITYETTQERQPHGGVHGVANVASNFFNVFSVLQLLAVLLLGPAMVAGTVAQEHQRRTIDYLFTSQLRDSEIVLGKLAARLLHIGFLVAAGIPVLAIAMLLGGIPPASVLGLSLITLETLVAVASVSIAVSVTRRRTRDAVISAYVILAALLILPLLGALLQYMPLAGALASVASAIATACEPVAHLNPFEVLRDVVLRPPAGQSLVSRLLTIFAAYAGFSTVCLVLAVARVRRGYLRSEGKKAGRRRTLWPALRPAVWNRSLVWKEMFIEPAMGRLGWIGRLALFGLLTALFAWWGLALYVSYGQPWSERNAMGMTIAFACCLESFGVLLAAARAATAVTSEKERDSWVMLLSTPLVGSAILGSKILGNLFAVRWIVAAVLVLWIAEAVLKPEFIPAIPVQLLTWLALLVYASCLGTAFSLWCRSSLRSMAATVGLGTFVGLLYIPFAAFFLEATIGWGDVANWIIWFPCIPFLLTYPAAGWAAYINNEPESGGMLGAYIFGMILYLCVTGGLWLRSVRRFGELAGRMPDGLEEDESGSGAETLAGQAD